MGLHHSHVPDRALDILDFIQVSSELTSSDTIQEVIKDEVKRAHDREIERLHEKWDIEAKWRMMEAS